MRLLFFGTPKFAVPVLESLLLRGDEIAAVVTQPDRPQGRHLVLTPPPVKTFSLQRNILLLQPEKVKSAEFIQKVKTLRPELIVVAAFGQIFPKELLDLPRHGCWNVHASLLPAYRGANPIQRCILAGDAETGISIMQMGVGLDSGDVLSASRLKIGPDETTGELEERLAEEGGKLLAKTLQQLQEEKVKATPQDDSLSSYAAKIKKEEAEINWSLPARQIHNLIRGLNPSPGAHTAWNKKILKVWMSSPVEAPPGKPGKIFQVEKEKLCVHAGKGGLSLLEVQLPGKRALDIASFLSGHKILAGEVLGNGGAVR